MNFGRNRFGRMGAIRAQSSGGSPPPASPSLDFSQSGNSQYQPLVMSLFDDPYKDVDRELMGVNWKVKGQTP